MRREHFDIGYRVQTSGIIRAAIGFKTQLGGPAPSMKALLAIAAAASFFLTPTISADPVQITTWNLEWFPGRRQVDNTADKAVHISLVHEELVQIRPDILLFQEVRSENASALAARALPGMKLAITSRFPGRQQVSIVSRFEAKEVYRDVFQRHPGDPPRGFARALFETEPGKHLLVYAVHLKSNKGGIETNIHKRESAARLLIADEKTYLAALAKRGITNVVTILGGDFNTDPTDPQFAGEQTSEILLNAGFKWTFNRVPHKDRITWPSDGKYRDACFDGFFVRLPAGSRVSLPLVHAGSERASDHRAVSLAIDP